MQQHRLLLWHLYPELGAAEGVHIFPLPSSAAARPGHTFPIALAGQCRCEGESGVRGEGVGEAEGQVMVFKGGLKERSLHSEAQGIGCRYEGGIGCRYEGQSLIPTGSRGLCLWGKGAVQRLHTCAFASLQALRLSPAPHPVGSQSHQCKNCCSTRSCQEAPVAIFSSLFLTATFS